MRARAIRDLGQLSDRELFATIAEGLQLVKENALRLEEDARVLRDRQQPQGHLVLRSHAEEEAAKTLILLDAIRCPRKPAEVFTRHLSGFNEHLAKGIYAECYRRPFWNFGHLEESIAYLRREFYLDGPNDVDWIFRNSVLSEREGGCPAPC